MNNTDILGLEVNPWWATIVLGVFVILIGALVILNVYSPRQRTREISEKASRAPQVHCGLKVYYTQPECCSTPEYCSQRDLQEQEEGLLAVSNKMFGVPVFFPF